ncbi:3239_t:CDS:1, partial [Entrophospora sp. SA101]
KMESTEGFSYRVAVKVNIAICFSCDQFVYVDKRVGYALYHNYKMEEHWHTNCTGNRHCDISFKEYMELKQKPEVEYDIYTRLAIYQYELRIENLIKRVKHIRETAKKNRACTIIQRKWLEYFYHPDGMCAKELAEHYKLL